jgi:Amt family ammonium transporter
VTDASLPLIQPSASRSRLLRVLKRWALMGGGVLVVLSVTLLDKLKIDDVVGAIPAHLVCGIWGTMIVPLTNDGTNYVSQAMGVGLTAVFVSVASAIVWFALKFTIGVRPTAEEEEMGLDRAEIGLEAYPEFSSR